MRTEIAALNADNMPGISGDLMGDCLSLSTEVAYVPRWKDRIGTWTRER